MTLMPCAKIVVLGCQGMQQNVSVYQTKQFNYDEISNISENLDAAGAQVGLKKLN